MRIILTILLSIALATSAGCFGKDDEGGDGTTPTPTTPTATTPTGTTPTGTTPTTPTGNSTPTPTKPAAREVGTVAFDFATAPDPAQGQAQVTAGTPFNVPAGYTTLTLNVTWTVTGSAPLIVQSGVSVDIVDAAGTVVATCPGPAAGPSPAAPAPCSATGTIAATGGDFTPMYHGKGTLSAAGNVVAS